MLVHLELARASNLPTIWVNTATGLALSGVAVTVAAAAGALVGFTALYSAGMYLNDYCDREHDRRRQADRPIARGAIDAATVLAFSIGWMLVGLAALLVARVAQTGVGAASGEPHDDALGGHWSMAVVCLVALIVVYDLHHKRNPLAPLLMAACRALVIVSATLIAASSLPAMVPLAASATAAHVYGITAFARQSSARRVGFGAIGLASAPLLGLAYVAGAPLALIPMGGAAITLYASWRQVRDPDGSSETAVAMLIAGVCWVDAVLLIVAGEPYWAVAAMMGYPLTRCWQQRIRGT